MLKKIGSVIKHFWVKWDLPLTMPRITAVAAFVWSFTFLVYQRPFISIFLFVMGVILSGIAAKEQVKMVENTVEEYLKPPNDNEDSVNGS